jgi:peptidoglycan/xylan/chitin deacetylase (PgdA/CDA1 family)
MIKKISIIISVSLFSLYALYIGYQCYSNNRNLIALNQVKITLKGNYDTFKAKLDTLEQTAININVEKENVKTKIKEQEDVLKQTNDKIAVKEEAKAKTKISSGGGNKVAYLTFDDGPSNYTHHILDILNEYGIKATFFVNGREDTNSIFMYKRIVNEGHAIGNHSYVHRYQTLYTSVQTFDNDFNRLQDLILKTTGVTMDIMRFPGGSNNEVSNSYSNGIMDLLTKRYKDLGYTYFDWNSSAGDTAPSGVTTDSVINKITSECSSKKRVIILMHDTLPTTYNALPTIIEYLANKGFKFMPLSSSSMVIQFK